MNNYGTLFLNVIIINICFYFLNGREMTLNFRNIYLTKSLYVTNIRIHLKYQSNNYICVQPMLSTRILKQFTILTC